MRLFEEDLAEFNYLLDSYVRFIKTLPGINDLDLCDQISEFADNAQKNADPKKRILISSRMHAFFKDYIGLGTKIPSIDQCTFSRDDISIFFLEWYFKNGEDLFLNKQYHESLLIFHDVLSWNPEDYFDTRNYIPVALIETDQHDEADSFLNKRIKIDSAFLYNRVLLDCLMGRKGDFEQHARAAYNSNAWITNYLTGNKKIPKKVIVYSNDNSEGTANEAKRYIFGAGRIWFKHKEIIKKLELATKGLMTRKITKSSNPFKPYGYSYQEIEMIHDDILNSQSMRHEELLGKVCKWSARIFESSPWLHAYERSVFLHFSSLEEPIACHFTGNLGEVIGANIYISESEYKDCIDTINDLDDPEQDPKLLELKMNVYSTYMRSIFITRELEMRIPQKSRNIIKRVFPLDKDGTLISPDIKHRGLEYQMCNKDELIFCLLGLLALYHSILSFSKARVNYAIRIDYSDKEPLNKTIKDCAQKLRSKIKEREQNIFSLINKFNKETRFAANSTFDLNVAWLGNIGIIKKNENEIGKMVGAVMLFGPNGEIFDLNVYKGEENPLRAFVQSLKKFVKKSNLKPSKIIYLDSPIAIRAHKELIAFDIPQEISRGTEDIIGAVHQVLNHFAEGGKEEIMLN